MGLKSHLSVFQGVIILSLRPLDLLNGHIRKINDLDKQVSLYLRLIFVIQRLIKLLQLGKFANGCLQLGRVAGLLLSIKIVRELLRRAREAFFRNATALLPELYESARQDSGSKSLDTNFEHYFIPPQYFKEPPLPFDVLPSVLEELAQAFNRLHIRIDEFREFTDEGLLFKSLLLTLEHDLLYRASCARVYSGRLNTPPIQRYIHQFTDELESDFEKVTLALSDFTAVGVSAISHEQRRSSQNLTNILTVATFFSGVTASTLAMSTGASSPNPTLLVANMLWFASLVFSVGAALNSLLAMAWKETRSGSRGGKLPFWVTMWVDGSQLIFLGISIVTFSAGLVVYAFCSGQAHYTPYVTVSATGVTFIGLIAISIWMVYEMWVSPVLKERADVIKSSAESVHSKVSKLSMFSGGLTDMLSSTLFSLGRQPHREPFQQDVESVATKDVGEGASPDKEDGSPVALKAKLKKNVKSVALLNTVMSALITTVRRHHKQGHMKAPPKAKLQIDTNVSSAPVTQLKLPSQPSVTIDLQRYGTIRDIAYSEDGSMLAVTWQSWTVVYDAKTLFSLLETWHEGRAISERLVWSPSGSKLIIKFEHRFDVWDLDTKNLQMVERHHQIQGVEWCREDSFLVAEHSCVFKMNLDRVMAVYRFEHMHVRSIALERKNNYLIVIARVDKSQDHFEPASGRSEKRIVIYDMDKEEAVYQVPVLENISRIYPVAGELDLLITHKGQKAFQVWSLDAGLKGTEITARLKKRTITPHLNPGDYVGPTCIGGNYSQFILCGTSSGTIEIWRRESGMPYQRFCSPLFEDEGLKYFSWRRSKDDSATFATAGEESHVLHIWQGEEPHLRKPPTPLDSFTRPLLKGAGWTRLQHVTSLPQLDAASSSSLSPPSGMEKNEAVPSESASPSYNS
ncbi:hypothetical protein AN958_01520 [Leucoagaricus sp. SymC.cos]|nr:hypothetical protein AN958_01520 [Leucoagaricus sp. SymC.cos]